MPRDPHYWTAYRRYYVRHQLARGKSRWWIAEELGCSQSALANAIQNYGLNHPEPGLPERLDNAPA